MTFCEYNFGQVYEWALKIENEELENMVFEVWKEQHQIFNSTNQIKKLIERNNDPNFFLRLVMRMQGVDSQGDESSDKVEFIKAVGLK